MRTPSGRIDDFTRSLRSASVLGEFDYSLATIDGARAFRIGRAHCGKFITTEKALEAGIEVRWIPEAHPTLADDCSLLMKSGPSG